MSIMMAVSGWQLQSPSILGSGTISISFSGAAMKRDLMRSRLNGQKLADPLCAQFSLSLSYFGGLQSNARSRLSGLCVYAGASRARCAQ